MARIKEIEKNEEIKSKIINVASRIVSEEGIENLSIRKITKELEYSPGIIYHYFKDKTEVIQAISNVSQNIINDIIRTTFNPLASCKDNITNIFRAILFQAMEYPEQYKLTVFRKVTRDELGNEKRLSMLSNLIKEAMDKGEFKSGDEKVIAYVIWMSFSGLNLNIISNENITKDKAKILFDAHIEMIFNGLI